MCAKPRSLRLAPRGSAPLPAARGAVPPSVPSSQPSTLQNPSSQPVSTKPGVFPGIIGTAAWFAIALPLWALGVIH
jgi:hypothetical protein